MSTPDFRKVRFVGPLSVFASEWGEHLLAVGYTPSSATVKLQLAADLSRWMDARRLSPSDLTGPVINEFVRVRRATHTQLISLEALAPMLDHLRSRGAVPALPVPAPESAEEVLLARYRHFLAVNRGLTSSVIDAYSHWIGPFLTYLTANGCSVEQGELTGDVVAGFLTIRLETLSRKSAKMTASVVRSFLGFAHTSGLTSMSLAAAVPAVISRRLSGLPQPLSREHEPDPAIEEPTQAITQSASTQTAEEEPEATPAIPHANLVTIAGIKAEDHQLVYDLLLDESGWCEVDGSRLIVRTCAIGDLQVKLSCANYYVKAKYGTWQHASQIELLR